MHLSMAVAAGVEEMRAARAALRDAATILEASGTGPADDAWDAVTRAGGHLATCTYGGRLLFGGDHSRVWPTGTIGGRMRWQTARLPAIDLHSTAAGSAPGPVSAVGPCGLRACLDELADACEEVDRLLALMEQDAGRLLAEIEAATGSRITSPPQATSRVSAATHALQHPAPVPTSLTHVGEPVAAVLCALHP